jgi:hypothetical protein
MKHRVTSSGGQPPRAERAGAGASKATGAATGAATGKTGKATVTATVTGKATGAAACKATGMVRPYTTLFAMALIVALLARIGLFIMDQTGALSYDYISASKVPILDVICSILTGSAFVAFLFVSGLALTLSTAGVVLYALLFAQRAKQGDTRGRPVQAFLAGWATALAALVSALIVVSGILSSVQVGSMSSKLPALPMLILALIVFAAFLGTLLAAASLTICACIARAKAGRCLYKNLMVAAVACGIPVMLLTVATFSAINASPVSLSAAGTWFGVDLVVNIFIMTVAGLLIQRAGKQTEQAEQTDAQLAA